MSRLTLLQYSHNSCALHRMVCLIAHYSRSIYVWYSDLSVFPAQK